MNTEIRKFYEAQEDGFGGGKSTAMSETEMKIFRAAGYDAQKVKAIRELMEEEAVNYFKWMYETFNEPFDGMPICGNTQLGGMTIFINHEEFPIKHSYEV